MNPPADGDPAGEAPAGRRERRTVLPPLPQVGGPPAGGAPAGAVPPSVEPPRGSGDAAERPAAPPAAGAATGRTDSPAVLAGDTAPAPPARARAARPGGSVPRIVRGRRRRDAPAPGEKPDRRLPVYFWFHNVRFLRELRLDMEAGGARPGDLNDSLLVRAAVTALERTGAERFLRVCRNEDQAVRALVARLEGAPEAEVVRMVSRLIDAGEGEAGTE